MFESTPIEMSSVNNLSHAARLQDVRGRVLTKERRLPSRRLFIRRPEAAAP
jgi:hypothetical protein